LSVGKNKLVQVGNLENLSGLVMLDLHQNMLESFDSVPRSEKLDQILLAYNQLTNLSNLERAPNLSVLDLHNNKLDTMPETIL
jgi:Leucine-rich repeat (LRR) protein